MVERESEIQEQFQSFQKELDEYNDRRERLIKSSRDVTTASKRLIFALHRYPHQAVRRQHEGGVEEGKGDVPTSRQEQTFHSAAKRILSEAHTKRDEIVKIIVDASKREGLDLEFRRQRLQHDEESSDVVKVEFGRAERYERAMGSGLEEFIEAISFLHFLEHASLIRLAEVQSLFQDEETGDILFPIPASRYLLGLSDLTGELMRFATTNAAGSAGQAGDIVVMILNLMRDLRDQLDAFVPLIRDMKKKQIVTNQSMRKIEDISYAIKVRSAEYGSNPAALQEMLRRSLAASSGRPEHPEVEDD